MVVDNARILIEESTIRHNDEWGVIGSGTAQVTVQGCDLRDNKHGALLARKDATIRDRNNKC